MKKINKNKLLQHLAAIGIISLILFFLFEMVVMPLYVRKNRSKTLVNVISMDVDAALVMLKTSGFKATVTDTIYTSEFEQNIVLDQFPKPNKQIKRGRTVQLRISQAEKLVEVPSIIGKSSRSAELILRKIGLNIGLIDSQYDEVYPAGVVIGQTPFGGDQAKRGFPVHLIVSKGQLGGTYLVPSLFGLSKDAAEAKLKNVGLKVGKIRYNQNTDLIPYTVLDQSIEADRILSSPVAIDITISVMDMQDIFNQVTDK